MVCTNTYKYNEIVCWDTVVISFPILLRALSQPNNNGAGQGEIKKPWTLSVHVELVTYNVMGEVVG